MVAQMHGDTFHRVRLLEALRQALKGKQLNLMGWGALEERNGQIFVAMAPSASEGFRQVFARVAEIGSPQGAEVLDGAVLVLKDIGNDAHGHVIRLEGNEHGATGEVDNVTGAVYQVDVFENMLALREYWRQHPRPGLDQPRN